MFQAGELVIELGFQEPFSPDSIKQAIAQIQRAKSFLALDNDHHRYVVASAAQGLGYALLAEYERSRPYLDEALRDCLVSQSAGGHEGFSTQRWTTFEVRSSATGRKSGHRWAEKTRAQPGMILPNSL